ncbi:hypothetical protein AC579_2402 [Pseudocercospora musae]|uniref:Uncharacterized protein n=1 Tax=Pseudocercospora musae TaxID=113226 RepID=A0A139HKL7_9PEZI|nr:hypothetical protein AC579_2402 [Pseudocercospora musae]
MGIAVPSAFYSIGDDLERIRNALQVMNDNQNSLAAFPESAWLKSNRARYQRAMDYIHGKVLQPLGLLNVTDTRDWARQSTSGNSSEPNVILYRTLLTGADLAS